MRIPAQLMKQTLLLLAALAGMGLFGLPVWAQESDSEDGTQVDQEADDESAEEGTADEESSDETQGGDEEEAVEDPSADDAESAEVAASGEEEESTDDAEDADAEQSVEETEAAEEAAPAQVAQEPGQSSVAVERWSVTLQSAMGVRDSELTMEKPVGGAVVATISHVDGGESRTAVQLSGNNLSWAWDVTNPMPMQISCEATIQGEQMAGICDLGAFGKAPMHGSRQ